MYYILYFYIFIKISYYEKNIELDKINKNKNILF